MKISGVQLEWSATDIQAALVSYGGNWADQPEVILESGAARVRVKVTHERLPVGLPVELRFTVLHCEGTTLILGVTWSNLGLIPGFLKEIALQKAFEQIPGTYENGQLRLELGELLDEVPATFQLETVIIGSERVIVRIRDLVAALLPLTDSQATEVRAAEAAPVVLEPVLVEERALEVVPERTVEEHGLYYKEIRAKIQTFVSGRVPAWVQPVVPWLLAVPDFFVMMVRLVRDPRVSAKSKILVGAVIAYFLSPLDLIPDLLGGLGLVDDLAIALFAIDEMRSAVPAAVLEEAWPGEGQVLETAAEGVRQMTQVLPGRTKNALLRLVRRR
ncbi:MAG TPA: DUF1232 domain-containing protein [Symbiobacteriaceae bacterium]|nr:DUF1232 domain-containing protein [Symbiobacteriaceae bacterium]